MSKNYEAFLKARQYLHKELPLKVRTCSKEALKYGTCVSEWDNLRKGDCEKEFIALKACIKRANVK